MKNKSLTILFTFCLITFFSCSQNKTSAKKNSVEQPIKKQQTKKQEPHSYGGYYCPDNLGGFPAVDSNKWRNVPAVNGRLATKQETQNGTAIIFVDPEKYPNAKPLDIKLPKLARYYNNASRKKELVIIIQAMNISNDSIVAFRYLNGGNGSARLNDVKILLDTETEGITSSRFVTINLDVKASKNKVWDVLTKPAYSKTLQAIFDKENKLKTDWNTRSKVNFKYANAGTITSQFAGDVYGNQYIQIDSELGNNQYVEKFLVSENEETNISALTIVCGPYGDDFISQKLILKNWAQQVKIESEKK